ncbi:glutamyl-tRNA(Gln) amidotransferase subunit A, mitochondrial [Trichonephila clavata]|uniref:Glutamyl-tRNA(Gln) amidotransferase subunit A, mitochondrial n=1 Tax=Trichonephila clavata TaxID=2740835 RepID=A0A8X6KQD5_TRICU|nr:glutamyl-tRNA(Gln) amidotransferase subunit A, mitochondrial [Trichonephila clavata]
MSSILTLPITKVSQMIKKKILGVTDLCSLCLERINKTKNLNAFITVSENIALEQSSYVQKRINEEVHLSILDGIPIAFKDNWSTKNVRTTCASKMLSNYIAPYDATVVEKLCNKGAVMMGKTNLDEFAMGSATVDSYFGPTRNPWRSGLKYKLKKRSRLLYNSDNTTFNNDNVQTNQETLDENDFFVAGGSSGGSAVAVASGSCFGAIGSDTGGSTRNPAAFCGIVGLKPTYGLVSRNGLIPLCNSLDVPGILTRTIDDAAVLLNILAGHDFKDSTTVTQPFSPFTISDDIEVHNLRIGIPEEYGCPGMSSEVINLWKRVADTFENAGAKVTTVSLPHTKFSIMCYSILCCCDVASNFARYDGIRYGHRSAAETTTEHHYAVTRREGFGDVVRERILAGNYFLLKKNYEKYFLQAAKVRRLIYNDFEAVFKDGIDLLLTPVTLSEPVPYSKWILTDNREHNAVEDFCTQPVNMAGLPAVSVPCSLSKSGLPLSLQLIGKPFHEKQMLTAAKWMEQQMDFPILDLEC